MRKIPPVKNGIKEVEQFLAKPYTMRELAESVAHALQATEGLYEKNKAT